MKQKSQTEILIKWGLYTPRQQEVLLAEFRARDFPMITIAKLLYVIFSEKNSWSKIIRRE